VDRPVNLIPLICPQCNTRVPANPEEVAWVCAQCGQGLLLNDEKGLFPIAVYYASNILPGAIGKPYWVVEGQVSLQRESYDSGSKQNTEAEGFWRQKRRFFVPAYPITLEALLAQGVNLILQQPLLEGGPPTRFEPVVLTAEAIYPTAEFIVMAVEAGRKDKLKKLDFRLSLAAPVFWILPA
jgi:hypothetical protein